MCKKKALDNNFQLLGVLDHLVNQIVRRYRLILLALGVLALEVEEVIAGQVPLALFFFWNYTKQTLNYLRIMAA